jgi:polyisoprenyl-phosphate glycosyltransferase
LGQDAEKALTGMKKMDKNVIRKIVFIIPIYNEADSLPILISQITSVVPEIAQFYEPRFLFVDNGSIDESRSIIITAFPADIRFGVLSLSRNFGYETAIIAGLDFYECDAYGVLDGDGEDPISLLPLFVSQLYSGYDIVQGLRLKRKESYLMQKFRSTAYRLLASISDEPFTANVGNFSVFNRKIRDAVSIENRTFPFMRATLSRVGYKVLHIPHDRNSRIAGNSKYKKFPLVKYALLCFLTSTTWPLRLSAYVACMNIALVPLFLFFSSRFQISQAHLHLILILLIQLAVMIGILSVYVARIYKQMIGRPIYYADMENSFFSKDFFR